MPLVSIILPVYNSERFVKEAIDSILNQTFRDFEFIIINDGSVDNSRAIIESIRDPRIIFVNQNNSGLAATLNVGLSIAKGKYIARQDNDDISMPDRLQKQVDFLEANPQTDLVGTWAEIIDEDGRPTGRYHKHPCDSTGLKFALLFNNPFVHSSVMFTKRIIDKAGNYDTDPSFFEDYNLWSRIARMSAVSNIPEVLLKYREVNSGMSKSTADYNLRVKRQSINNILFYCPTLDKNEASLFVDIVKLVDSSGGYNKAFSRYTNILDEVCKRFCEKENITTSSLNKIKEDKILQFRRHAYNSIIYSPVSGAFEKAKATISRKLMFMLHRKNFIES